MGLPDGILFKGTSRLRTTSWSELMFWTASLDLRGRWTLVDVEIKGEFGWVLKVYVVVVVVVEVVEEGEMVVVEEEDEDEAVFNSAFLSFSNRCKCHLRTYQIKKNGHCCNNFFLSVFLNKITIVSGTDFPLIFAKAFISLISRPEVVIGGRLGATMPLYPLHQKYCLSPVLRASASASLHREINPL